MEFREVVALRQSTRAFAPSLPSRSVLAEVARVGRQAPIGMHRADCYRITVITQQEVLAEMGRLGAMNSGKGNPFYDAPVFFLISHRGEAPLGLQLADASCIVDHLHLAATEAGLGSVYIYGALQHSAELRSYLQEKVLPQGEVPLVGLAVGIAEHDLRIQPSREEMMLSWLE